MKLDASLSDDVWSLDGEEVGEELLHVDEELELVSTSNGSVMTGWKIESWNTL